MLGGKQCTQSDFKEESELNGYSSEDRCVNIFIHTHEWPEEL
jgi:hypothetical protein